MGNEAEVIVTCLFRFGIDCAGLGAAVLPAIVECHRDQKTLSHMSAVELSGRRRKRKR